MVAFFGEMAHVLVLETEHLLQRVVNECCTSAGKVHKFTQMRQEELELRTMVESGPLMAVVAGNFFENLPFWRDDSAQICDTEDDDG